MLFNLRKRQKDNPERDSHIIERVVPGYHVIDLPDELAMQTK